MSRLTFDLRRGTADGPPDVTRLEGVAGLAVMMQTDHLPIVDGADPEAIMRAVSDMPVVSLRAATAGQLAILLGTLIASVEECAPAGTVEMAIRLSMFVNASRPEMRRVLPAELPSTEEGR